MSYFHWPVRVYYEDTDGGGVVYHANYLKYMERARTEWLRNLGFDQSVLKMQMGIIFVVREIAIQYRKPACFNDALDVLTTIEKIGRSLFVFKQTITRNHEALIQASVEVACVSAEHFKPVSIPQPIRLAMQTLESE